jgi:23S rRNA (cytidine1920-2'-O)/16S rRNA (cytidine1409-2'-O)-methyltransferase
MSSKPRLDELLVRRGLAASRAQAAALIRAGRVRTGDRILDKPGHGVAADLPLTLSELPRYVSRGGDKLAGFLAHFPCPVAGAHALDVGASTGGFTDCLLQAGAASVTCVDVGYGQLHYKLRTDPRVTNIERVNARHLRPEQLPRAAYGIITLDLSFISLRLVLPAVWPLLAPGGWLIALVKPQFEAGKAEADAGRGVIRDEAVRARVLAEIQAWVARELPGAVTCGCIESPLAGADGNREYLASWRRATPAISNL